MQPLFVSATWLFGIAAAVFGWLFYGMYWQYRGLFNEEGRYFDGVVVHHDQSLVLIIPAGICVLLAAIFGTLWRRRREVVARHRLGGG